MIENKINGELSNFEIRKDYDTNEESKEYYFLIGFSSDKIVKVATIVLKKKDVFYFSNIKEQRIAICHGTTDCMPKKFKKDHWGCDCVIGISVCF